jgi:hypothetical protein
MSFKQPCLRNLKGAKMKSFLRRWFSGAYGIAATVLSVIALLFITITILPLLLKAKGVPFGSLPVWEVENPVSTVFVMDSIPLTTGSLAAGNATVPNEYLPDPAIDTLLLMMAEKNIFLHQTVSQPSGIVGSDNIVIIKGNFQWTSRNTTSTDRIKGVIWQILQHPNGFTGEILVCDNTQEIGTGINHGDNNSEDQSQSIVDVVNTFYSKGYPVYYLDWNFIWSVVAVEYSEGSYNDGFVYESVSKISYPKFKSPSGEHYISLRYGIWDSTSQLYNSEQLCIIDFPVLKAHSMAGSTVAVKNWIGVLTTAHASSRYGGWQQMHHQYLFGQYALVARVMSETYPKLTILDAAWTSPQDPNVLTGVVNTKMLLASIDPCAVSWYAAKFILTPVAVRPWETDPDRPNSLYRNNLSAWTTCLQDSGYTCTMDSIGMSVYDRGILAPSSVKENKGSQIPNDYILHQNYPNPFNSQTVIKFELLEPTTVRLNIYDANGSLVKSLVGDEFRDAGQYHESWDGTDSKGYDVSSGVYFYRLEAWNFSKSKSMILAK